MSSLINEDPFTGYKIRDPPSRYERVISELTSMGVWTEDAIQYIQINGANIDSASWVRKRNKRAKELWKWYWAHRLCINAPHCSCMRNNESVNFFNSSHDSSKCNRCHIYGT